MAIERKIQASITVFLDDTSVIAIVCQGDAYSQHASVTFDHRGFVPNYDISVPEAVDQLMARVAELLKLELVTQELKQPASG